MSGFARQKRVLSEAKDLVDISREYCRKHAPHRPLAWQDIAVKSHSMHTDKYYVYMLTNDKGNVLYIGFTEDLKKRIYFHKHWLIPGFTKKYNVHRLVYYETYFSLEDAEKREKQLKGKKRAKKNALVESVNTTWRDLSSEIS